jgi:predicted DsbA family dithiol-disulfide isomerase
MRVDIWSDLVCPWCYVGKRRFERALGGFAHRGDVQIVHRSFQLDPRSPRGSSAPRRDVLMAKYRLSETEAAAMDERMTQTAAAEGLEYHLTGGFTGNTFDAHQVVHLGAAHERQDGIVERLFRAHFTERRSIFERASLVQLATEAGLESAQVGEALETDRFAAAVTADVEEARALGITGVPFFLIDRQYAISGAQPADVFAAVLERVWSGTPS